MTRALTRTSFHSAELVRVLAELSLLDTVEQGDAFAEKLGQWVSFTDAITLSAVHNASTSGPSGMPEGVTSGQRLALDKAFERVQAGLVSSIGRLPKELSAPEVDTLNDPAFAYEPYRRHYQAQQREIELKLSPLRVHVREVLGQSSPRLRKLAALDAALDGILCEREGRLLQKLPSLLEKRFKHLRQGREQATEWLADFCQELQTLLRAELDLRMQPVLGLIEACQLESITGQHKINE
ncbi:DUF3348 family protein [Rhodoferax sp.]|uniref:DUF3348 family protein n=1 Tax=Rhodoferax sp. TaxID=50421 RepID=UPI0027181954|nr:DUF3348 family protein [Rhodoferax sp.]MDO9144660.1 DUF3348 family protein [Rhodoferax sp.]